MALPANPNIKVPDAHKNHNLVSGDLVSGPAKNDFRGFLMRMSEDPRFAVFESSRKELDSLVPLIGAAGVLSPLFKARTIKAAEILRCARTAFHNYHVGDAEKFAVLLTFNHRIFESMLFASDSKCWESDAEKVSPPALDTIDTIRLEADWLFCDTNHTKREFARRYIHFCKWFACELRSTTSSIDATFREWLASEIYALMRITV